MSITQFLRYFCRLSFTRQIENPLPCKPDFFPVPYAAVQNRHRQLLRGSDWSIGGEAEGLDNNPFRVLFLLHHPSHVSLHREKMDDRDTDIEMGDDPLSEVDFRPPPTFHELDQLQYHISLQEFGEKLQKAANSAFPNNKRMRYASVYVLLICWDDEDPKLPVSTEIEDLHHVFEEAYHFDVEFWRIPSEGSHKKLNRKVLDFVELGDDSRDDLKIVYYGGHGMLAHNRQSFWARYVQHNALYELHL